jgi:hypothetical protein
VLLAGFVLHLLSSHRFFTHTLSHGNDKCQLIKGAIGAEDMVLVDDAIILTSDSRAFFISPGETTTEKEKIMETKKQGNVYLLKTTASLDNLPSFEDLRLEGYIFPDFHPHGLAAYKDKASGQTYVMIVNHRRDGDSIEVFKFVVGTPSYLSFVRTESHPLLRHLNDVAPVSPTGFYATNWLKNEPGTWQHLWEILGRQPVSDVVFCDIDPKTQNTTCKLVVEEGNIGMANGIEVDPRGYVYVVGSLDEKLHVYTRNTQTNELTPSHQVKLYSGCDNLFFDNEQNLWSGCHPNAVSFLRHQMNHDYRAPSQVIRIFNPNTKNAYIQDEFMSEGNDIAASSIALYHKGFLYIGAVFDDGVLVCQTSQ